MSDDGSAARARVRAASDVFRDLHAASDEQAAAAIRGDDIDVLLDVAGHTTGGRFGIVARRPARVQVEYLGFSASMASRRIDYAIVDRIVASQDAEWSERLIYMPHTWFLYDFRPPLPETRLTRADYGLPTDAFVYCAFHRAEKISPDLFALWMRILAQVPNSVLWCLELSETAKGNLRRKAAKYSIDPARLVFAPFEPRHGDRYLPRQRLGDLMLDSLYHNAMTTACDALGSGLPVLTLKGSALAARGGASFVTAAGVPELIVPDREAYVAEAIALARDPMRLANYRDKLLSREGPLFDTAGRVRELEACLVAMLGSR
jgi:predicted O-linked N-acetylglucosamine transferase (SPINDLY family)